MNAQQKRMVSELLPNTSPFPNVIMDEHEELTSNIWSLLEDSERSLLPIVYRKTFGWWKRSDRISMGQLCAAVGYSEETVRKYMKSLCDLGLVLRVSENDRENNGIEWAPQTDDTQINFELLRARDRERQAENARRMEKARARNPKVVPLSDRGTPVAQDDPTPVAQDHGTPVAQGTQKPVKTNKNQGVQLSVENQVFAGTKVDGGHLVLSEEETRQANALVDAVLSASHRAALEQKYPHRLDIPDPLRPLADAYVESTGQKPRKRTLMDWIKTLQEWTDSGFTPEMVMLSVKLSHPNKNPYRSGFMVVRPASLTGTLDGVQGMLAIGQRPQFDDDGQAEMLDGIVFS